MCKAATTTRVGRAGFAALAFVILSASLAEAQSFGPRIIIGKSYQQTSATISQTPLTIQGGCNNTPVCYVLFQRIPQQKPLIVQRVACHLRISAGAPESVTLRTRKGQSQPFSYTSLVPVQAADGWWVVNSPAMHLLKSGERPFIRFFNSANATWSGVECSISGRLQ